MLIDKNDTQDLEKCEDITLDTIKKCEGGTPNIRFQGFVGEWKQRKLSDICEYQSSSLTAKDVDENGNYDLYDANSLIGKTNKGHMEKDYITIIKDGAGVGRTRLLPKNSMFLGTMGALTPRNSDLDFLYQLITNTDLGKTYTGSTIPHIYFKDYGKNRYCIPACAEQHKIGSYFRNLDNLITLHQRKCDESKELKKYMLQKMFPRDGEKVPEIRFQGFAGEWEQRKFGEFYEVNNERNKDLIGYDKTFSIATMTYKDEGNGAADSSLKTYKVLRIGDIAFEGHTNKEFRYGRFVANDVGDGIISPRFSTLRPINKMPVSFWKHYIHYEPVMRKKLVCSTKAGTMMNELVTSDFFEQEIAVPCIEEQRQIGTFLNYLDHLIALHQRKCDELKELKQYMLQNMFPQKI